MKARPLNRTALARKYNVSLLTVDRWVARGCPHRRRGRAYEFELNDVAGWRAQQLVKHSNGGNTSGRRVCPDARKILSGLMLAQDHLIPWCHEQILLLYGIPLLPPLEGEKLARVSIPHADRWRGMFAIYVEGLGGNGY